MLSTIVAFLASPLLFVQEKTALKTELKPFSRADLISWLETQDPNKSYNIFSTEACLWGRYTKAHGGKHVSIGRNRFYQFGGRHFSVNLGDGWRNGVACYEPHTFGAALERAKTVR